MSAAIAALMTADPLVMTDLNIEESSLGSCVVAVVARERVAARRGAAVDHHRRAGHVRRGGGEEEGDHFGDLVRRAVATERREMADQLVEALDGVGGRRRPPVPATCTR
jgi:hypothetical protein